MAKAMSTTTPKTISQAKLARYYELEQLEVERKTLYAELLEMAVKDSLPCQPGRFSLLVDSRKGQVRPAWKDHFIKVVNAHGEDGAKAAENVIKATLPGARSYSITIVDRDNPVTKSAQEDGEDL